MKSTTGSQLSEQGFQDYLKATVPSDKKLAIAYMFGEYAWRFGIPLRLRPDSAQKYAKICATAIRLTSRWLTIQIEEAWSL